jgi:hypothetical protein
MECGLDVHGCRLKMPEGCRAEGPEESAYGDGAAGAPPDTHAASPVG